MTSDHGRTGGGIQIGMVSLGCPKNLVDGESMLGLLSEQGYGVTPNAGEADLIIVNTCGFIDSAKKESISAILDMCGQKRSGRCRGVIVTGCLSERYGKEFARELPEVDVVLGTGEYGRIVEVVNGLAERIALTESPAFAERFDLAESPTLSEGTALIGDGGFPGAAVSRTVFESTDAQRLAHLSGARLLTANTGYAYVKIAEGCDNRCTYCVIPDLRGPYLSRPVAELAAEVRGLARERDMEIVLVAQDTTRYGMDFAAQAGAVGGGGNAAADGGHTAAGICALVDELSQIPRVRWIRLLYCYPDLIGADLIDRLAENSKLVRYLDIPIQHASDAVLRRMGRRYGRRELDGLIAELRRRAPDIVLRTTLMTGFPGETDGDFSELLDFVQRARFDRLGVFSYSREDGTPAAAMRPQIPKKVARARRTELIRAQAEILAASDRARVGHEYEALIDAELRAPARGGARRYVGRTYGEAPQIDGQVRIRAEGPAASAAASDSARAAAVPAPAAARPIRAGDFVRIRVTRADARGLEAEVIP